ncbi:hypothetical protein CMI38_07070 [Candidatus Pacearchaeota archaeon]|jgi:hypothetical protein|nr:hypothetical protein [Candidatus Pacearchaeota archaeon]|tara:strand:+ start:7715 stop:8215 length:501 start_codon:yes stop_codon:yes gene_type:complete
MKKLLFGMVVALFAISLVFAFHPDPYDRYMPSFNIKLTEGGSDVIMEGDPTGSVSLSRGDNVRVILFGLEADTYYSLHHGSDCIDLGKKTNRHGALRTARMDDEFDYSDLYHMRDVDLGGDLPTLDDGDSKKFEVFKFKCGASSHDTEDPVLKGVEPKNSLRVLVP